MLTERFKSDRMYHTFKYEASQGLLMSRNPDLWASPILGSSYAWMRLKAESTPEQLGIF